MILKLIILALVTFLIGWTGEALLRRKFDIEKRSGWARSVNKVQTLIEIALFVVYFVGIWFALDYIFLYMISFFAIINLFRAFMHWKYEREKKQYILFLYEVVILLVIFAVAYWWIFE
ncbi:DUF4181 domain-containing protein [Bacillus sp. JJ1562]|uniref:DUF4181 domain-containing protein n=1 Tax=Bacillus sp. JJ1562 TaxID=3122960 RepID=UPI0030024313